MAQTPNTKLILKPTLDFLLHRGLIVRSINSAGEQVYTLTIAGEVYFGGNAFE